MTSILIHNPRCSKSRGAKEILEEKGIEFTLIDYTKGELTEELLAQLPELLQLEFSEFVRVGEKIYQELRLGEKNLTNSEWVKILKHYPILLERPIYLHQGKGIIARPPERLVELLKLEFLA